MCLLPEKLATVCFRYFFVKYFYACACVCLFLVVCSYKMHFFVVLNVFKTEVNATVLLRLSKCSFIELNFTDLFKSKSQCYEPWTIFCVCTSSIVVEFRLWSSCFLFHIFPYCYFFVLIPVWWSIPKCDHLRLCLCGKKELLFFKCFTCNDKNNKLTCSICGI